MTPAERHMPRPDPRGPHQQIVESWKDERGNYYRLDCGHISEGVSHFHLDKPGADRRCFACGRDQLTVWSAAQ